MKEEAGIVFQCQDEAGAQERTSKSNYTNIWT